MSSLPSPVAGTQSAQLQGGKLLIVEDSKSFGSLLNAKIQNSLGLEIVWARSFSEAQTVLQQPDTRFFLSLLDLHLPDAPNGEIVDFVLGKGIPGIVLTGEFSPELRDAMLAKGVLDYFIKDHISVIDAVIYFIDRIRRNMEIPTLVVDDSISFRGMICRFLRSYGFMVLEAGNGQEAMERMAESPVALVITDFQMPGMDGYQLTKKIREKYSRDQVAIIGLSSQGNRETPAQFIKAGANDFLTKPFRNEELFCRVSQNIEIIEKHRKLESLVAERTARLTEAHTQLQAREQYLRLILDSALDAIITTDEGGHITDFNPAAEKLFGYAREEVLGKSLAETVVPENLRDKHQTAMDAWIERQHLSRERLKRRIEMPARRANGDVIHLQMALTSITNQDQLFLTAFMHDITERMQLVKSLQDTLEVAESANRAKSEFLANMSHEIRTPMNAIIGMTELVLESQLSEEQRGNLTILRNASHALLNLLNSILDLSKIDAGRLKLEKIPFDLLGRVENACETIAIMAQQKGLELWCWVDPATPSSLMGDPTRFHQVLLNLINNAVKFTQEGEIVVRVQAVPPPLDPDGVPVAGVHIQVSVSDTGIGIAPERLGDVFDRFTQADGSITRRFGGSGLGLTISRHLARMMGGDIRVESQLGQGSAFHFSALFEEGTRAEPGSGQALDERAVVPPARPLAGLSLLLGVRSPQGREILQGYLESFGATPTVVEDVASLRNNLENHLSGVRPIQLFLADAPFLEMCHALKESIPRMPEIPTLLLLPLQNGMMEEGRETLFTRHGVVRLPARRFALLRGVQKLVGRFVEEEKVPVRPPAPQKSRASLRILLVEDLEEERTQTQGFLERAGHGVTLVEDGESALQRLARESFDLVLLDLILPGVLQGVDVIQKIRTPHGEVGENGLVPIVAITSRTPEEIGVGMRDGWVNGCLPKPCTAEVLMRALEVVGRSRKMVAAPGAEGATPVLKPMEVDPEVFRKARAHFLLHTPERLKGVRRSLEIRDATVGWNASEWIKNTANAVGAVRVKIKAMRLRGKIEMHQWDEARITLEELNLEVKSACEALQKGMESGAAG